jgi:hypothetical protein
MCGFSFENDKFYILELIDEELISLYDILNDSENNNKKIILN